MEVSVHTQQDMSAFYGSPTSHEVEYFIQVDGRNAHKTGAPTTTPAAFVRYPTSGGLSSCSLEEEGGLSSMNSPLHQPTSSSSGSDNHLEEQRHTTIEDLEGVVASRACHIRRLYRNDPYCIYTGIKLISLCNCEDCLPSYNSVILEEIHEEEIQEQRQHLQFAPQSVDDTWPAEEGDETYTTSLYAQQQSSSCNATTSTTSGRVVYTSCSTPGFTPYPSRTVNPKATGTDRHHGQQESRNADEQPSQQHQPPQLAAITNGICMNNTGHSSFMPPAPPLVSRCSLIFDQQDRISAATAGGGPSSDEEVSRLMNATLLRWYTHVAANQINFLPRSQHCPQLADCKTMDNWSTACHRWWNRNFSRRQMKYPTTRNSHPQRRIPHAALLGHTPSTAPPSKATSASSSSPSHSSVPSAQPTSSDDATKKKPVVVVAKMSAIPRSKGVEGAGASASISGSGRNPQPPERSECNVSRSSGDSRCQNSLGGPKTRKYHLGRGFQKN